MTNVDENQIPYPSANTVPPVSTSGFAMAPGGNNREPCVELLDPAIVQVLRRKTPTERVAMVFAANRTMRLRLEGHLRSRHPDWDDQAVMQEIARRMSRGAN